MLDGKLLIGGKWETCKSKFESLNPATGEVMGKASLAGKKEIIEAVEAAGLAFPAWKKTDLYERADIFIRIGDEILRRKQELKALMAGNTAVFKPSDLTPFVGIEIGKICQDAGIPDGVINVVTGDSTTGECLVSSDIDMISGARKPANRS